jgi:hypothetical protein
MPGCPDLHVLLDQDGKPVATFTRFVDAQSHLEGLEAHVRGRLQLARYRCTVPSVEYYDRTADKGPPRRAPV